MTARLDDFIIQVLNAATFDEQKITIANELAHMRTFIKECDTKYKPSLIAKIMFLSMRGDNTQWANIEIANLMANDRPSYKRIAYLAAINCFENENDLMVLITHTMAKDLKNPNPLIQMLPLTLLAQIGTADMCRELSSHIIDLLQTNNQHIIKRVCAAMHHSVQLVPDLSERFRPYVHKLLSSSYHCVVCATIDLAIDLMKINPGLVKAWQQFSGPFTKIIRTLYETKPIKEFDFFHFNDPFLLTKILKILSYLGTQTDELDDLLSTIVTGVDVRRNTGRTILFQAIQTIKVCAKKPSLRSLAYNQIGRLFSFKDANVLYSALSTFSRVLYGTGSIDRSNADSVVLQRYKSQVVQCLSHRDPSIRRRALDVIVALVDANNVETLIPEVMSYLPMANAEFRTELVAKLFTSITRFAPNENWKFETVRQLIIESGAYVGADVITSFCKTIVTSDTIRDIAIVELAKDLAENSENQALIQVGAYCCGEYAEDASIIQTLKKIMTMPQTTIETNCYVLVAIAKLGEKLGLIDEAIQAISTFANNNNLELQQRSGELIRILRNGKLCGPLLAPADYDGSVSSVKQPVEEVDLLGTLSQQQKSQPQKQQQPKQADPVADLLGLSASPVTVAPQNPVTVAPQQQPVQAAPKPTVTQPPGTVLALKTADYVIYFELRKNTANPNQLAIRSHMFNLTGTALSKFKIQYQIPSNYIFQIQNPSAEDLPPIGGPAVTQVILLQAKTPGPLMMKTQTTYLFGSQPLQDNGVIESSVFA